MYNLKKEYEHVSMLSNEYTVCSVNEFTNTSRTMSVVMHDEKEGYFLVCKGAPEAIALRCQTETLPEEYNDTVFRICSKGLRLLAFAFRRLSQQQAKLPRDELEAQMDFAGFYAIETPLKSDAVETISDLR